MFTWVRLPAWGVGKAPKAQLPRTEPPLTITSGGLVGPAFNWTAACPRPGAAPTCTLVNSKPGELVASAMKSRHRAGGQPDGRPGDARLLRVLAFRRNHSHRFTRPLGAGPNCTVSRSMSRPVPHEQRMPLFPPTILVSLTASQVLRRPPEVT